MAVDAIYNSSMAQFHNREKMLGESTNDLNLGFGIPISLADSLQNFPATGNTLPFVNTGLNLLPSTEVLSEPQSGLTANNNITNSRKRVRESCDSFSSACRGPKTLNLISGDVSLFLDPDLDAQIQQQQQDIERFIVHQMETMRLDLEEKRRRHARQLMAVLKAAVVQKLNQNEAEIKYIEKMNIVLEERVRSLSVENQLWQNLARNNAGTANALKINLAEALARATEGRGDSEEDAVATAESICCDGQDHRSAAAGGGCRGRCRRCGEGESSVLLLPCRHLCVCCVCAPAVDTCPICQCSKTAPVQVYFL